jgi:hypothetical protein
MKFIRSFVLVMVSDGVAEGAENSPVFGTRHAGRTGSAVGNTDGKTIVFVRRMTDWSEQGRTDLWAVGGRTGLR